jgi:hypothetical protein
MKKKVLAMVLVAAMVVSMGAVAYADDGNTTDAASSSAGIAFWIDDDDNTGGGDPALVDPGKPGDPEDPGTGEIPGGGDPDNPNTPPTTDPGVVEQIRLMDSGELDFHLHNLAHVRVPERVTMQSLEGTTVPATAEGIPDREPGNSRLGLLVYREAASPWTLQARMGPFSYPGSTGSVMSGYDIVLTQNGINVAAPHSKSGLSPTTWQNNITLRQDVSRFIVATNGGGQGIHGQEYAGALSFVGTTSPESNVRAQANIFWSWSPALPTE